MWTTTNLATSVLSGRKLLRTLLLNLHRCFRALVSKDLITYVEDRKGHDRRYAIAPDKIKAEIGWYPETDFATGIKKTIAWFFEHEDWMKNVTSGDYQKYYDDMYANK